jgi:hypothetical protein
MMTNGDRRPRTADRKTSETNKMTRDEDIKSDTGAALFSLLYSMVVLAFFSWQLFDTWIGQHSLPRLAGYDLKRLDTPNFRLIAYTLIGGGLGGTVNGIRSGLQNYHGFKQRYLWKYIAGPWMGASLALLVYALIHSSVSVFGGGTTANDVGTTQALANFAAGALAGYGSKAVFIWLDAQVDKLFPAPQVVPDVTDKPKEAAVSTLQDAHLAVGSVAKAPREDQQVAGTVVDQTPSPGETVNRGDSVALTVADDPTDGQDKDKPS